MIAKLQLPDFVNWDRGTVDPDSFTLYGWIQRPDGKRDFALIIFDTTGDPVYCASSSAKYSAPLTAWCVGPNDANPLEHTDCEKWPAVLGRIETARASVQRCRVCGCTEERSCSDPPGRCSWAADDLCSVCARTA